MHHEQAGCPELAQIHPLLLTTIANSVPSERAWSMMNFIHTKGRNKLSIDTVNKLMFIYINARTLQKQSIPEPGNDELVHIEDRIIGLGI